MAAKASRRAVLRRAVGFTVVYGLLVAALIFYRTQPGQSSSQDAMPSRVSAAQSPARQSPSSATPSATAPSATAPSATAPSATAPSATAPSATALSTPEEPTTASRPGVTLPDGPGTTEPGILLFASPNLEGNFDVAELVLLTKPVRTLKVRPPDVSAAGGAFAAAKPYVSMLQISVQDQPLVVPDGKVKKPVSLPLNEPADRFELRYQLGGATVRSVPSTAGRALAAIGPLTYKVPADIPVAVVVTGESVQNLQCPTLVLAEQSCATGALPRLRVNRPLARPEALVVVQFDLPRPQ